MSQKHLVLTQSSSDKTQKLSNQKRTITQTHKASPRSNSVSGVALKLNPNLSANSDLANRLLNGSLSASRDGIRSSRSQERAQSKHGNRPSTGQGMYHSPHSGHQKATSLLTPSKISYQGQSGVTMSPKVLPSETVVKRFEEIRQTRDDKMRIGTDVYDSVHQRKEIEQQVQVLEKRIQRLQIEEKQMIKKINDTAIKTEKILDSKKRHQEDLFNKYLNRKNREENTDKRRKEINKGRDDSKNNLLNSMLGNLKQKHDISYTVKTENTYFKAVKKQIDDKTMKENKNRINRIKTDHNEFLSNKNNKDFSLMSLNNSRYVEKLETEKKMSHDLSQKYKHLEKIEQQLLEKLSNTYSLHQAKINQLEKAFNLKVSATQPVTLESERDYDDGKQF